MGMLVDGHWQDVWYDTESSRGRFVRADSAFRDWIRADASTPYGPAAGRYHLYVSTEADWRLFTTLVRFDAEYGGHFKCNRNRIADFAALSGYLLDLYQVQGVAQTVRSDQIKLHYYASHRTINPTAIVACGPTLDLDAPHDRAALAE